MIDLVGNHLWQSTLFAIGSALLTLLFRKNNARVRYWLWLAASIKLIIPFSLFIAIGSSIDISWRQRALVPHTAIAYAESFSQPFGSFSTPTIIPATTKQDQINWIIAVLAAIWFCGIIAVLSLYMTRSRNLSAAVQKSEPLKDGRLCEILRALEKRSGCRKRIKLAFSSSSMEPGVFGIFQPVLMMPKGISARLKDSELEAIIAHEVAHVRHHDNLLAVLHMTIEALFWFHPMVWWLGSKLVQERERACDEEVLKLGKDPQSYAEGILKVCEFYLDSPRAYVTGITGADMKKRIQSIMNRHIGGNLSTAKKLMLTTTGIVVLAFPVAIGLLNTHSSSAQLAFGQETIPIPKNNRYDDVTIKRGIKGQPPRFHASPSEFLIENWSLQELIVNLHGVPKDRIIGLPAWTSSETFSVRARSEVLANNYGESWGMLIPVLENRFKLKCHREKRQMQIYELSMEVIRVQLPVTVPGSCEPIKPEEYNKPTSGAAGPPFNDCARWFARVLPEGGFSVSVKAVTMAQLAEYLEPVVGRHVIDRTGLTTLFDIESLSFSNAGITYGSQWAKIHGDKAWKDAAAASAGVPSGLPNIFASLKKVGLRLTPGEGPVEVLMIDQLERPFGN
jgi:bla regulator protein blaR1